MIPLSGNPRGRSIVILHTIFQFLDVLAVACRLYSRRLGKQKLAFNDWAILVALALTSIHYGLMIALALLGCGLHTVDIISEYGEDTVVAYSLVVFIAGVVWPLATLAIKLSILHFYTVVFRVVKWLRYAAYGVMLVSMVATAAFFTADFTICQPLRRSWDFRIREGGCGNNVAFITCVAIANTMLDIVIFGLPLPLIWRLKMKARKKVANIIAFGIGLVICVISGVRLIWIVTIDFQDVAYGTYYFGIFGQLEPALSIIAACLPTFPLVVQHAMGRNKSTSTSSKGCGERSQGSVGRFERMSEQEWPLTALDTSAEGYTKNRVSKPNAGVQSDDRLERGILVTTELTVDARRIQ